MVHGDTRLPGQWKLTGQSQLGPQEPAVRSRCEVVGRRELPVGTSCLWVPGLLVR